MRILFVNYTMNIGGIETFLLSVTKKLKNKNHKIDFLCYEQETFDLEKEVKSLGSNIYKINNPYRVSFLKHIREIYKVLKNNNYDIVHCHTYTNSGYVMLAAFLARVKIRVTHSHTSQKPTSVFQKLKWQIAKILISIFSNRKVACSKVAGDSLFSRNYEIVENGIDIDKYSFNKETRNKIRDTHSIKNNEIVIGHVGRFAPVKNHKYIIELFSELDNNYKLLLVGSGPELDNIKKLVKDKKLKDRVILTGSVKNTNEYYNAMDLILFPSLYEGLPLSLVEAQMNGLYIIASDTVSKEIDLFGNVHFFSLNDSKEEVIKKIYKIKNKRNSNLDYFKNSNYNIENTCLKLLSIYKK